MPDNAIDVTNFIGIASDKAAGGPGPANTPVNTVTGKSPDLGDIVTQAALQNRNVTEAITNIIFNQGQYNKAAEGAATATMTAGDATAKAIEETGKLKLQEQDTKINVMKMMGVDLNVEASTLRKLREEADTHYTKAQQAISEEETRNPISRFVRNKLKESGFLPDTVALETGAAGLAEKRMGSLLSHTQQALTVADSIAPTVTAASVDAAAQAAKAKATIEAAQIQQATAAFNTQQIHTVSQMKEQQLSNSVEAYRLLQSAESMNLQRQSMALAFDERKQRLSEKKETEDDAKVVLETIKTGAGVYGKTFPDMSTTEVMRQLRSSPQAQAYYQAGSNKLIYGTTSYGDTPSQAIDNLYLARASVPTVRKTAAELLQRAYTNATSGLDGGGKEVGTATAPFDKKNKEAVSMLTNANAEALARADHDLIDPKNQANIYQAPKATDIIAVPGLQNNEFIQTVVSPLVKNGMTNTDPDLLLNAAVDAISANPSKFESYSQGLSTYFNTAITLNNANVGYKAAMGLPPQEAYNTRISGIVFGHEKINMADLVAVKKAISKRLAEARARQDRKIK